MKKIVISMLTILMITCSAIGLVACKEEEHVHEYSAQVTTDAYLKEEANCGSKAKYYYSCSCGEKGTETFESGETTAHLWKDPSYVWSADNLTCTATTVCYNDSDHVLTETVNVVYADETNVNASVPHKIGTYTATFTNTHFGVKVRDKNSEQCVFGEVEYSWAWESGMRKRRGFLTGLA